MSYRASQCTQSCGITHESSAGQNRGGWAPGTFTMNTAAALYNVQALAWQYLISSCSITGGVPESLYCVDSSKILWFQILLLTQWVEIVGSLASEGESWTTPQCVLRCLQTHCLQLMKKHIRRTLEAEVPAIGTDRVKVPDGACLVWSGTLHLGPCNQTLWFSRHFTR